MSTTTGALPLALILILFFFSTLQATPPKGYTFRSPSPSECPLGLTETMFRMVNQKRSSESLPPILLSPTLSNLAVDYGKYLAVENNKRVDFYRGYSTKEFSTWWAPVQKGPLQTYITKNSIYPWFIGDKPYGQRPPFRETRVWKAATQIGIGCLVADYPKSSKIPEGGTMLWIIALIDWEKPKLTTKAPSTTTKACPPPMPCPTCAPANPCPIMTCPTPKPCPAPAPQPQSKSCPPIFLTITLSANSTTPCNIAAARSIKKEKLKEKKALVSAGRSN